MEVIMKSMVKILFAIMALSLGEVSVSAASKGKGQKRPPEDVNSVVSEAGRGEKHQRVLEQLLQSAVSAGATMPGTGDTLVHAAVRAGGEVGSTLSTLFIGQNVSQLLSVINTQGLTPLALAISLGSDAAASELIPLSDLKQTISGGSYLIYACEKTRNADIVAKILETLLTQCHDDSEKTTALAVRDSRGHNVVQVAIIFKHHNLLRMIAPIPQSPMGASDLAHAMSQHDPEAFTILINPTVLAVHANPFNEKNADGKTVVHLAALVFATEGNPTYLVALCELMTNEAVLAEKRPNFSTKNKEHKRAIDLINCPTTKKELSEKYPFLDAAEASWSLYGFVAGLFGSHGAQQSSSNPATSSTAGTDLTVGSGDPLVHPGNETI